MALLEYSIKVVGKETVAQAFASIEARIRQHNRTVAQMTGQSHGARAGAVSVASRVSVPRGADPASRAAAHALREEVRIKNAINALNIRDIKREERMRLAAVKAEGRERQKVARTEELHLRRRSDFARSTIGNGLTRATGTVGALGRTGAAMVGIGGAGLAAASVAGATRLDEMSRRIIVNSRQAGETSKFKPEQLRQKFTETGIAEGLNPEDVARGAMEFVSKTGDIDAAIERMTVLAKFSQATGSDMAELAGIGASMFNNGIKSTDDMAQALATLTFQGKKASFELKDMAQFMPSVMAKGSKLGMKGVEGAQAVGSLLQIAQMGTQNSAESATAVERMMDQFIMKGEKFESGEMFSGRAVKIFTDKSRTKMRNPLEVIPEMLAASQGNITQLFESMDIRGSRALDPIVTRYNETVGATKGTQAEKTAAGVNAVKEMLADFREVNGSYKDIQRDAADAMKSFSVQLRVLNTRMQEAIASKLFPELIKLVPEIAKLVPYVAEAARMFVELAKAIAENPLKGLGAILALQFGGELAKAKLGEVMSREIAKAFASAKAPGGGALPGGLPGAGATPNAAGSLSPAGSILSRALPAVQLVDEASETVRKGISSAYSKPVASEIEGAGKVADLIRNGDASPQAMSDAQKRLGSLQGMIATGEASKQENSGLFGGIGTDVKALFADLFGGGGAQERVEQGKAVADNLEALQAAAKGLKDAMDASAGKLDVAATKLGAAGEKLASSTPNRGNAPSPVKN